MPIAIPNAFAPLLLCALLTVPLAAQRAPANRAALPDSANSVPVYPTMLRSATLGGVVRVTFVVDSTGRPDMASYMVRESAHELFTRAVTNAIPRWRFAPAIRAGRQVADTVEQLFEFVPPPAEALQFLPARALAREAMGPRRWRTVIGGPVQMPPLGPVADSLHLPVAAAAMDTILASLQVDTAYPARIACLALGMTGTPQEPPLHLLRRLSRSTYTVVASRRCPKTFGSMFRRPEPDPPGEDPWIFTPLVPQRVDDATVLIDVAMKHATMVGTYHCVVQRDSTRNGQWRAACARSTMGVH